MKKNRVSKHVPSGPGEHIAELDDYELKPHYDLDYSKAKPNRFAGRVKFTHGGARPGAGRKPATEPVERHMISFSKPHVKLLRALDQNLSKAIRKLIESTR
ncbi:MAG: hypothetical protein HY868_25430 [Chloroflexi bacterium]|nr:hypothetical protein [Chloroflexota bacterium]